MKALPILNPADTVTADGHHVIINSSPKGVTLNRVRGSDRKVTIATHLNKEDFDNAITGDLALNPDTGRCFVWTGRRFKKARNHTTNALRSWMKDTYPTIHDTIQWNPS